MFEIPAEKTFENHVKKWLHSVGIYPAGYPENKMIAAPVGWYFKVWGGGYQKSGIPDLILNVRGYFVAAELKALDGTASELQLLNVRRINQAQGFAFVLYPSAFGAFKEFIEGLLRDEFSRDSIPIIWK